MRSSTITAGALGLAAALVVLAAPATAEVLAHIVYSPTSLPSAQGWEYLGENLAEQDVFRVADGVLIMDTMGTSMGTMSWAMYSYGLAAHPDATHATVRWRLRVIEAESLAHPYYHGFSFAGWPLDTYFAWYPFNIDDAGVYLGPVPLQDLDTTVWRDYVLSCSLDGSQGALELLVDGQAIAYPADQAEGALRRTVLFGDEFWHANAHVEIAEIEITIMTEAPVATESRSLSAIKALFRR